MPPPTSDTPSTWQSAVDEYPKDSAYIMSGLYFFRCSTKTSASKMMHQNYLAFRTLWKPHESGRELRKSGIFDDDLLTDVRQRLDNFKAFGEFITHLREYGPSRRITRNNPFSAVQGCMYDIDQNLAFRKESPATLFYDSPEELSPPPDFSTMLSDSMKSLQLDDSFSHVGEASDMPARGQQPASGLGTNGATIKIVDSSRKSAIQLQVKLHDIPGISQLNDRFKCAPEAQDMPTIVTERTVRWYLLEHPQLDLDDLLKTLQANDDSNLMEKTLGSQNSSGTHNTSVTQKTPVTQKTSGMPEDLCTPGFPWTEVPNTLRSWGTSGTTPYTPETPYTPSTPRTQETPGTPVTPYTPDSPCPPRASCRPKMLRMGRALGTPSPPSTLNLGTPKATSLPETPSTPDLGTPKATSLPDPPSTPDLDTPKATSLPDPPSTPDLATQIATDMPEPPSTPDLDTQEATDMSETPSTPVNEPQSIGSDCNCRVSLFCSCWDITPNPSPHCHRSADFPPPDEAIVNAGLVHLLKSLTWGEVDNARWTMKRARYTVNELYTARTDGYLDVGQVGAAAIIECKAAARDKQLAKTQYQESAEMVAWLHDFPDQGDLCGVRIQDGKRRRFSIAQDHLEIYIIIAEFTDCYVDFLLKSHSKPYKHTDAKMAASEESFLVMKTYGPFSMSNHRDLLEFSTLVVALTRMQSKGE